jgi:predicted exporter
MDGCGGVAMLLVALLVVLWVVPHLIKRGVVVLDCVIKTVVVVRDHIAYRRAEKRRGDIEVRESAAVAARVVGTTSRVPV